MKLVISQLKDGENPLSLTSDSDAQMKTLSQELASEGIPSEGPLLFKGVLHKHEPDYYLQGHLTWKARLECSRCAEPFVSPLEYDFQVSLAHHTHSKKSKIESVPAEDSEDLDLIFFEGNDLDLQPLLHEQFVLSLPFQSLCQENCKGICQHCGTNLNREECQCAQATQNNPFSVLKTMDF